MKIKSIKQFNRKADVYDFETPSHSYILNNGVISHNTMEMFSKAVVSGGTGIYYSADTIIIFGRQQEKEGTDLAGWNFILNVDKSRFVKEKSKIPLTVLFESGINKFSGILDLALESGDVVKPKNGWYAKVNKETGEVGDNVRFGKTQSDEFLGEIMNRESFKLFIKNKYRLSVGERSIGENEDLDIPEEE